MSGNIEDSLIAWDLRNLARILFTILFISLVFLVSFLSRKTQTIFFLTVVTAALIFFLLMVTRNEYGLAF